MEAILRVAALTVAGHLGDALDCRPTGQPSDSATRTGFSMGLPAPVQENIDGLITADSRALEENTNVQQLVADGTDGLSAGLLAAGVLLWVPLTVQEPTPRRLRAWPPAVGD